MKLLRLLLLENKAWARGQTELDPTYFENMSKTQNPEILWIGCSDSRVPPDEVINTKPGSLFVHRNIANLVYEDDENLMSVIEYAVKFLKVKYIIVCGHYNCGGVKAALDSIENPRLKNWTRMISDLIMKSNGDKDLNSMVERNVIHQVENLSKLAAITDAWNNKQELKIVGWVYDLEVGLIKELKVLDREIK